MANEKESLSDKFIEHSQSFYPLPDMMTDYIFQFPDKYPSVLPDIGFLNLKYTKLDKPVTRGVEKDTSATIKFHNTGNYVIKGFRITNTSTKESKVRVTVGFNTGEKIVKVVGGTIMYRIDKYKTINYCNSGYSKIENNKQFRFHAITSINLEMVSGNFEFTQIDLVIEPK